MDSNSLPKYHTYNSSSSSLNGNDSAYDQDGPSYKKHWNSKKSESKLKNMKKKATEFMFNFKDLKLRNLKNNSLSRKRFIIALIKLVFILVTGGFIFQKLIWEQLAEVGSFTEFFTDFFNEDAVTQYNSFASLDDPEYYNFDFRNLDVDTVSKFDKGAKHFLITHEAQIITDQDKKTLEAELEMLLATSVQKYDLRDYDGSPEGAGKREHVLLCVPLRNAEPVLPLMFKHLMNLTYPHELIDLAFLVSDCSPDDKTLETLLDYSKELQNGTLSSVLSKIPHSPVDEMHLKYMNQDYLNRVKTAFEPPFHKSYNKPFRSIQVFQKDFGQVIGQGFSDRHAVKVQGVRRKLMGRARNWLATNALKPYHSWIYWRDVDIELSPGTVIQDLMSFDYDVVVPNVWRPLPVFLGSEQPYDLNSWIESPPALELAKTLDEDDVIVEGYAEYPTWRVHLANLRNPNGNTRELINLDGVGGVSILAKAKLFRKGINFPAFTFENHAETEAFGKMARKMGFRVGGLPHYTLWHIYEPSEDDLKEMASRDRDERNNGN